MIETSIRNKLLERSQIVALVGDKIYFSALPQNPTFPAISFFRVSNYRPHNLNTASQRFQFDCWSATYSGAVELADEIRQALQGEKGIFGSYQVIQGTYLDENIMYEPDTKLHHVALDMKIIYRD